jgi:predicted HD phosphohydrolase
MRIMQDRYRNRYRVPVASDRVRRQIAREAARRLYGTLIPAGKDHPPNWLDLAGPNDLYLAKRKAAAVLGHRIRPGDLPSDAEVREELVFLQRESSGDPDPLDTTPEPAADTVPLSITDHLDRFAIYKMRLEPLETVKQNPKYHPEGDALFHSLQVFELARDERPYDEEFLLAALLHDVGKAVDPQDHVAAGVEALRGAVTERTLWLIEHHMDLLSGREKPLAARLKRELESSEYFEDLKLLRELDDAGRVPGQHVDSLDEVLAYLKGLEDESYLDQ